MTDSIPPGYLTYAPVGRLLTHNWALCDGGDVMIDGEKVRTPDLRQAGSGFNTWVKLDTPEPIFKMPEDIICRNCPAVEGRICVLTEEGLKDIPAGNGWQPTHLPPHRAGVPGHD